MHKTRGNPGFFVFEIFAFENALRLHDANTHWETWFGGVSQCRFVGWLPLVSEAGNANGQSCRTGDRSGTQRVRN